MTRGDSMDGDRRVKKSLDVVGLSLSSWASPSVLPTITSLGLFNFPGGEMEFVVYSSG